MYLLGIILLLLLLFFAKGLLTPSINYENEVVVDKSAKEAWAVMSDQSNMPKWISGFIKSELKSGTANTVGAVSDVYIEEAGEEMVMEETITAINEYEHMAMSFTMDFMDMDYEIYFKEDKGKTKITSKSSTEGNSLVAKSIISFMPSAMKEQEDKNLANLKKLINENTRNYFPEPIAETSEEIIN